MLQNVNSQRNTWLCNRNVILLTAFNIKNFYIVSGGSNFEMSNDNNTYDSTTKNYYYYGNFIIPNKAHESSK